MAIVKFLTKSSLKSHGESAFTSSESYQTGVEGAHHTLRIKTSDSHSAAIQAFENKINDIAQNVFVRYPELLTKYGTIVTTYTKAVEGVGFTSDILRTQKTPIKNVKKWLEVTTADDFEKLHKALDTQLEAASAALKLDPDPMSVAEEETNTRSELSSAKDKLEDLGRDRLDVHNQLESALQTFKSDLQGIIMEFGAVSAALRNARFMNSLPAEDVGALIASGKLTAENIDELDSVQGAGDGAALKVLLNEGGDTEAFFTQLGSVDTTDVSEVMMYKIYLRTHAEQVRIEESEQKDFTNIEAMAIAISQQPHNRSRSYSQKMAIAADHHATILTSQALALNPRLGSDTAAYDQQLEENAPELAALDKDLKTTGRLAHLFESMYVHHIGAKHSTGDKNNTMLESRTIQQGSLKFDPQKDAYSFTAGVSINGRPKPQQELHIVSTRKEGNAATKVSALSQEYAGLDAKRLDATKDFVLNMATLGASSKYAFMINTVRNASELFGEDSSMQSRLQAIGKQHVANNGRFGTSYSDLVGKWPKGLSDAGVFYTKILGIEADAKRIEESIGHNAFDIGGYVIENTNKVGSKSTLYRPQYDLQAILQMDDLEKNGLRGYIYRSNGEEALKSYDQAISHYRPVHDGSPQSVLNEEIRDVLAGKGGLADQNLVQVFDSIDVVQNNVDEVDNEQQKGTGLFGLNGYSFTTEKYINDRKEFFSRLIGDK